VGKITASDSKASKVRAVLGMRRRCAESRLERAWARQDYGACSRLHDSPIAILPDTAGAGDLAQEVGEVLRGLARNPHILNR
jgi:hypothetical protein